jgi:hypothetical protein
MLSEIFDIMLRLLEDIDAGKDHASSIKLLERKISSIKNMSTPTEDMSNRINQGAADMTELYRSVALIYVARVSESISGELQDVNSLLDRTFALLSRMHSCEPLFPLFILACEARTEDQRTIMLDLIRRTAENTYVRSMDCFMSALQSLWVQTDLRADQDLEPNYIDKLSVIISSGPNLPSLV